MKNILISLIFLFSWVCATAQVKGVVTDLQGDPLAGATVHWAGSSLGTSTDTEGRFTIREIQGSDTLVISYIGYENNKFKAESGKELEIAMAPGSEEIDELLITTRDPGSSIERLSVINTNRLSGAELCKAACCNLAESFTTNPSVDVSYSDAATGAKQIRLLGLSGLYVQMMAENMPAFRGLASVYGLEYIPGPWMESIQVSKGSASVINGYEGVSGQINVEYKKPQNSDKFFINGFMSSAMRTELNLNGSIHLNDRLSTMLLGHFKNDMATVDNNGDGFLDMPMVRQYNFINRWNYTTDDYIAQYGVKVIDESRHSGQSAYYNNDAAAYGIDIATRRYEFFSKQGFIFDPTTGHSMGIQISGSFHDQNSMYGSRLYDARQYNAYLNLIYQNLVSGNPAHEYSVGASLMMDDYDEALDSMALERTEVVPGLFGQYTYNLNDRFILLAGLRIDHHNEYGAFITPRLHAKYNLSESLHLRASVGMAYRSVNVIAENSYLLASSRSVEIATDLGQEKAMNTGLSATWYVDLAGREAILSGDYYYTRFFEQVVPDTDSDPHKVSFYMLDGLSYSHALQAQASYELFRGMDLTAAVRYTDVRMTIGGQLREKPLTSKYKGLLTASYQTPLKKWQFDLSSQFNGGGRMPDPNGTLWDPDFDPFTLINTQVTKYFKTWSIYLGAENLTNFKMETPIIDAGNPWGPDFDASMTWGPVHGIKIYGGFRFALERDN